MLNPHDAIDLTDAILVHTEDGCEFHYFSGHGTLHMIDPDSGCSIACFRGIKSEDHAFNKANQVMEPKPTNVRI